MMNSHFCQYRFLKTISESADTFLSILVHFCTRLDFFTFTQYASDTAVKTISSKISRFQLIKKLDRSLYLYMELLLKQRMEFQC